MKRIAVCGNCAHHPSLRLFLSLAQPYLPCRLTGEDWKPSKEKKERERVRVGTPGATRDNDKQVDGVNSSEGLNWCWLREMKCVWNSAEELAQGHTHTHTLAHRPHTWSYLLKLQFLPSLWRHWDETFLQKAFITEVCVQILSIKNPKTSSLAPL